MNATFNKRLESNQERERERERGIHERNNWLAITLLKKASRARVVLILRIKTI